MPPGQYVICGGSKGRERLRILARVMRPTTLALLERVGIRSGLVCLDVGCGGGDVSVELARMVAPSGRVVGIDIDAAELELARREAAQLQLTNLEFRQAEATVPGAEAEFDVIYVRFVLTHLSDPAAALAQLVRRLRPGGTAIVEDIDFRGHFCHPESPAFQRYLDVYTQLVRRTGADPNIGARLPELLLNAGCANVGLHVVQPAGIEGEVKLIAPITMENIANSLLAHGLVAQEEIDAVTRELYELADDHRTVMSLPRIVQAWGTR